MHSYSLIVIPKEVLSEKTNKQAYLSLENILIPIDKACPALFTLYLGGHVRKLGKNSPSDLNVKNESCVYLS